MRLRVALYSSIFLLAFMGSVVAIPPKTEKIDKEYEVSLVDCLRSAVKYFPLLKSSEFQKLIAQEKLSEARFARFVPKFELTAYTGPVPNAKLDPTDVNRFQAYDFKNNLSVSEWGPFFRVEVEAVQPIYTFGKLSAYAEMAENGVRIAEAEGEKARYEMIHQVKRAYYGIIFAEEMMSLLNSVDEKLDQAIQRIGELLKEQSESVVDTDLLKMKIFKADFLNRKSEALTGRRIAETGLKQLMGLHDEVVLVPKERYLEAQVVPLQPKSFYLEKALGERWEMVQVTAGIRAKKAQMVIARSEFLPTFFLGAGVKYGWAPDRSNVRNPFLKDDFNFISPGVALGLKQDLSFHRNWAKYKQAEYEVKELEAKREAAIRSIRIEIEKSYQKLRETTETLKINRAAHKTARSWLTSSVLSFDLGVLETNKLLESFAAYLKAKADLLDSSYRYNIALSELGQSVQKELYPIEY